jgi:hypothetical protein
MPNYNVTIMLPHSLLTHDPGGVTLLGFRLIGAEAWIRPVETTDPVELGKDWPC